MTPPRILIVDRDPDSAASLQDSLSKVAQADAADPQRAAAWFRQNYYDGLILDEQLPISVCRQFIADCRVEHPGIWAIILTSSESFEKSPPTGGPTLCLRKPVYAERLVPEVEKMAAAGEQQLADFTRRPLVPPPSGIVGNDPVFSRAVERIATAAKTTAPVLILGESGSGKDVLARYLHQAGRRAELPFQAVNSAGIPETLIESTLFGHRKGAFTGADANRKGVFSAANGGTLFLDEIGEMPPAIQASLLRAVETKTIFPVGSPEGEIVDVRIVTATHRDLGAAVQAGRFRADLYYRLAVWVVHVPPLRRRPGDIELLANHFLERRRQAFESRATSISPSAIQRLRDHAWPGNVRELDNVLQRAMLLATGPTIESEHIEFDRMPGPGDGEPTDPLGSYEDSDRAFRRRYFRNLLDATGGNRTRAASFAGISRTTLHNHLKELGIVD